MAGVFSLVMVPRILFYLEDNIPYLIVIYVLSTFLLYNALVLYEKIVIDQVTLNCQGMGVSQNHRAIIKKKVKEMKAETERELKARKQREKEQKGIKKEGKLEKMGFMKKRGVYNVN